MNFTEFKSNINIIKSADELQGWEFDKILTTFQNIVLDLDKIQAHVDESVDKINNILDK